jgi:hypothetical protein
MVHYVLRDHVELTRIARATSCPPDKRSPTELQLGFSTTTNKKSYYNSERVGRGNDKNGENCPQAYVQDSFTGENAADDGPDNCEHDQDGIDEDDETEIS